MNWQDNLIHCLIRDINPNFHTGQRTNNRMVDEYLGKLIEILRTNKFSHITDRANVLEMYRLMGYPVPDDVDELTTFNGG
jgi:hypothetical protein